MKASALSRMIVCVAGTAALLPTTSGIAAETQVAVRPAADTIEEVVVTARRREEKLQEVPIAVTVMSGEHLVSKGIENMSQLANFVPSLVVGSFNSGTQQKSFSLGIRGVRINSFLLLDDPTVGTYFAEGVIGHPYGFGDTFFDIQSVQVLKGPQGTLFGRNTTGGAVLVEPNKASIDDGFNGNIKLSLGDYNMQRLEGAVNIPLSDVAALRIAAKHDKRDGYTTNVLSGQKLDGVGNDALRIGFLIKPTRDITSNTIYDTLVENASPTSNRLIAWFGPNGGTGFGPPAVFQRILREQQGLGPWRVAENGGTNSATDQLSPLHCVASPLALCRTHSTPQETLRNWGLLNNTQVDFDGFSAKNIIAYRYMHHLNDMSENFVGGSIGGSINGGASVQQNEISQWQDEFQLLGKALDNRLDWVTGVFYMKEWGTENSITYTNSPNWTSGSGRGVNESKGLFAQGTYAVSDKLKATVGVRRNWDHRNAEATAVINNGTGCNERVGNSAVLLPIGNCFIRGDKDWQANTWTLALDYQLDKDTLLYTTHRHGYKSGGFALRAGREVNFPYDPEYVTDWEVGVKSDWSLFDRPVRTNFAYFNLDYTDQQVQVTNSTAVPVTTYIASAGKSKIWGAELEVTYKVTKRLELSGFYSYTNPKYLDYMTPVVGGVISLNARPFSMNLHNAGLSAAYTVPMDESAGIITLRGDTIFRSKAIADNSVAGLAGTTVLNAGFTMTPQAGFGQLNLRADWQRPFGNPVDLGIFVNNVSNYGYVQGGTAVNGIVTANISPPRMWGIELSYRFGEGFKPKE